MKIPFAAVFALCLFCLTLTAVRAGEEEKDYIGYSSAVSPLTARILPQVEKSRLAMAGWMAGDESKEEAIQVFLDCRKELRAVRQELAAVPTPASMRHIRRTLLDTTDLLLGDNEASIRFLRNDLYDDKGRLKERLETQIRVVYDFLEANGRAETDFLKAARQDRGRIHDFILWKRDTSSIYTMQRRLSRDTELLMLDLYFDETAPETVGQKQREAEREALELVRLAKEYVPADELVPLHEKLIQSLEGNYRFYRTLNLYFQDETEENIGKLESISAIIKKDALDLNKSIAKYIDELQHNR